MRLLVSFKICPDLELLREEDMVLTEEMGMDTHFLPNIINCYDESALELALRLRDKTTDLPVEVSAFTVGNEQAELTLKSLRALGFVHTVRAEDEQGHTGFAPEIIAETIAAYVRENPQDCILLGKEAPVGNQGIMAELVAEKIKYPLIGPIIDILSINQESVTVLVSNEGRIQKQIVRVPCVLCVGNAVISKLRAATLRERMKVSKTESEPISLVYPDHVRMAVPEEVSLLITRRACYQSQKDGSEAIKDVLDKSLQKVLEQI